MTTRDTFRASTERKFWFSPKSDEPVEFRFVMVKNRPPSDLLYTYPGHERVNAFAHARHEPCPFCWMAAEAKLRMDEVSRWEDEGGAPARPTLEDFSELNPRWVLWALSRGENPYDLIRPEGSDEPIYVTDYEDEQRRALPSAMVFSFWVRARWREWAASKGFTKSDEWGRQPHERALMAGHNDFDAWLRQKVGA